MSGRSGALILFLAAGLLLPPAVAGQTGQKLPRGFSETILGPVPDPVNMFLTPDKRHVAYAMPKGDKQMVLFDGEPVGPEFDGILVDNSFVLNSNGFRMAYAVAVPQGTNTCTTCGPQGKWHAVIDGQPGPQYDRITGIAFSPDGKNVKE